MAVYLVNRWSISGKLEAYLLWNEGYSIQATI